MSLLEAYASGLPIVTTNVAGVRNMVRHGVDGILVEPGSAEALAEALGLLLVDAERRHALGRAARDRAVADFSADTMARRYLQLLASMDPNGPWAAAAARPSLPAEDDKPLDGAGT
jgi:glycosyltransferase involved in cell wall biosynthesis